MIFEYKCRVCGKEFSKDTLVRCHNQRYCPECAKQITKERQNTAWKKRRELERKRLMAKRNER